MKVSLIQLDIAWGNPEANRKAAESFIAQSPDADLYLLPEMFDTGYDTSSYLRASGTETLDWMRALARKYDAAIAGSTAVSDENGVLRNRFYFVTPEETTYYDKHHLFTYAREDKIFSPGDKRVIVDWRGIRFLLQVCYDLRFPIWARNTKKEATAYHCILYVASWPASRRKAWDTLLKARAIENQCYVCGINRVGKDPHNSYSGGTMILDTEGEVIAQHPDHTCGCITANINPEDIMRHRKRFPVLQDRD